MMKNKKEAIIAICLTVAFYALTPLIKSCHKDTKVKLTPSQEFDKNMNERYDRMIKDFPEIGDPRKPSNRSRWQRNLKEEEYQKSLIAVNQTSK